MRLPLTLRSSLLAGLLGLLLAGCGASATPAAHTTAARHTATHTGTTAHAAAAAPAGPRHWHYRHLYTLASALRDPAYTALGTSDFALVGGLSAADTSTDEVDLGGLHSTSQVATIGTAQHDAQAALLSGKIYVFGGGGFTELSHIFAVDPQSHAISTVGALPSASSDSSVTQIGNVAYIVGGYDGTNWLDTVLAYRPGQHTPTVLARLPIGLRYSAVTVADGHIIVIGGTTPTGVSNAVYSVDPSSGHVQHLATLPAPICHGEAVTVGGEVYLIGGRGDLDNSQTAAILAIDPRTGHIVHDGALPAALSDAAAIAVPSGILVIGGLESSGAVSDNVGELTAPGT